MIALSAGHHPGSRGASWPEGVYFEYDVAAQWVIKIAWHLRMLEEVQLVPTGPLPGKIAWINALNPQPTLAAEIHFNSDESKKQRGSETLYAPGSARGAAAAKIVQDVLGQLLQPNRGAKEGWYRMIRPPTPGATPDIFLSQTRCVALILEPEFIYNRDAIDLGADAVCEAIAKTLHQAAKHIRGEA